MTGNGAPGRRRSLWAVAMPLPVAGSDRILHEPEGPAGARRRTNILLSSTATVSLTLDLRRRRTEGGPRSDFGGRAGLCPRTHRKSVWGRSAPAEVERSRAMVGRGLIPKAFGPKGPPFFGISVRSLDGRNLPSYTPRASAPNYGCARPPRPLFVPNLGLGFLDRYRPFPTAS